MATLSQVSAVANQLQIGNSLIVDFPNIIVLRGYCSTNANTTLKRAGASAGYQVTTGKRFVPLAGVWNNSATGSLNFGACTNDVGDSSATAFTGADLMVIDKITAVGVAQIVLGLPSIESGKFIGASFGGGGIGSIIVWGVEV